MSSRPTTPAQTSLIPINDCVLIRLDHTNKKEGKYDTRTSGTALAIADGDHSLYITDLLNKQIYFEEYKEGARIKRDGELFCFIKIEDIRGFEETNN